MPAKNDLETCIYFLEEFGVFLPQTRTMQKQNLGEERQRKNVLQIYSIFRKIYTYICDSILDGDLYDIKGQSSIKRCGTVGRWKEYKK